MTRSIVSRTSLIRGPYAPSALFLGPYFAIALSLPCFSLVIIKIEALQYIFRSLSLESPLYPGPHISRQSIYPIFLGPYSILLRPRVPWGRYPQNLFSPSNDVIRLEFLILHRTLYFRGPTFNLKNCIFPRSSIHSD